MADGLTPGAQAFIGVGDALSELAGKRKAEQKESALQADLPNIVEAARSGDYKGAMLMLAKHNPNILADPLAKSFGLAAEHEIAPRTGTVETEEGVLLYDETGPNKGQTRRLGGRKKTDKERGLGSKEESLTPFQKAYDTEFAKKTVEFEQEGGGLPQIEKNLKTLEEALAMLDKGEGSGGLTGTLPKFARDLFDPTSGKIQDRVQDVVFQSLRATFGAQFTEREGQKLVDNAYNPRLSPEENAGRIRKLLTQIQKSARAKAEMIQYAKDTGSLDRYKPSPDLDEQNFLDNIYGKSGNSSKGVVDKNTPIGARVKDASGDSVFIGQKGWVPANSSVIVNDNGKRLKIPASRLEEALQEPGVSLE